MAVYHGTDIITIKIEDGSGYVVTSGAAVFRPVELSTDAKYLLFYYGWSGGGECAIADLTGVSSVEGYGDASEY